MFRGLKRYLPSKEQLRQHRVLRFLGEQLEKRSLWSFNRHAVSKAAAIGLFWAFVPMPFQMIPAALSAIQLRANVPLAVGLVWLTNPLTMPPLYYGKYQLGRWVLGRPELEQLELTGAALASNLASVGLPLLTGALVAGTALALLSFALVQLGWRVQVSRRWRRRQLVRAVVPVLPRARLRHPGLPE